MKKEESAGINVGVAGSAKNYSENVVLGAKRGHGFAGEKANHLNDLLHGKDAKLTGENNAKNGADRLVDGVQIQTKYCATGSKCISECFAKGQFRYVNSDGSPMQIEVPSDKYRSAVQAMEARINKGQIPGVSDPEQAKNIVRKGAVTYEQVKNIAKFGTIESLTYDTLNGIKLAGSAMGISAALSYAIAVWNGENCDIALEQACCTGLKVGGVSWVSSIVTAQIGRTGVEQSLRGSTDWAVKQMGHKASAWLANGLRSGRNIYGAAAMNNVSKILRGNIVAGTVTTLVLSSADLIRLFDGRVSSIQVAKNITKTGSSVVGGAGGWMGGAAVGSVFGPVGTFVGGLIGGFAGGSAASKATSAMLDEFIQDDAEAMLKILNPVFRDLAFNYLLTNDEKESVHKELKRRGLADILRDMYASENKKRFAKKLLTPIMKKTLRRRAVIKLPPREKLMKVSGAIIEKLTHNEECFT